MANQNALIDDNSRASLLAENPSGERARLQTDALKNLKVTNGISSVVNASFTRPNDTTTYAAGDAVTDSTSAPTVITFSSVSTATGSSVITHMTLVDSANVSVKGSFELWLFDTTVTPDNDNSAFTPTDAELATCIGVVPFTLSYIGDANSGANGNALYVGTLTEPIEFVSATGNLFGVLVVRNAYIPVAQETFTFRMFVQKK